MQIAIVDDRAEDREELSACLENYMKKHQLDYTLTEFEDGENFLKAAAQVNFQLVFMDIYMENMDGMEAARRLRQKNRLCKIVFLTITEDYARMGYSLSASYYLLKPLSLHQADFEEAMELCQLKPPYEVMTLSVMADRQKLELPTDSIHRLSKPYDTDSYGGTRDTGKRRFSGGHCRIAEGQAFFALLPGHFNQHGLHQPG